MQIIVRFLITGALEGAFTTLSAGDLLLKVTFRVGAENVKLSTLIYTHPLSVLSVEVPTIGCPSL